MLTEHNLGFLCGGCDAGSFFDFVFSLFDFECLGGGSDLTFSTTNNKSTVNKSCQHKVHRRREREKKRGRNTKKNLTFS